MNNPLCQTGNANLILLLLAIAGAVLLLLGGIMAYAAGGSPPPGQYLAAHPAAGLPGRPGM